MPGGMNAGMRPEYDSGTVEGQEMRIAHNIAYFLKFIQHSSNELLLQ